MSANPGPTFRLEQLQTRRQHTGVVSGEVS